MPAIPRQRARFYKPNEIRRIFQNFPVVSIALCLLPSSIVWFAGGQVVPLDHVSYDFVKLLRLLILTSPLAVSATQAGSIPPFLEYKTRDEEFFRTVGEAAPKDMESQCRQGQWVACLLEGVTQTVSGYNYTFSHVIGGTPGGPDEVRYRGSGVGQAYYACPAAHALYMKMMDGTLVGPYDNRTIGPGLPFEALCVEGRSPEDANEYQSDLGENQCGSMVGNPINVGAGNKFQSSVDIAPTAASPLAWERFYNSGVVFADMANGKPFSTTTPATAHLGSRWRGTYDRSLAEVSVTTPTGDVPGIRLFRHTGERIDYIHRGSRYESVVDPRGLLRRDGAGWTYRTAAGELETYNDQGQLTSIDGAAGKHMDLVYSDVSTSPDIAPEKGLLIRVTDQHGRHLSFGYDATSRMASVRQDDGATIAYAYSEDDEEGLKADLAKVTYADGSSAAYRYNEPEHTQAAQLPHHLTGIIDEHDQRFATYDYDSFGYAQSSSHALGVGKVMVAYSYDPVMAWVIGPTGGQHTYAFETVRGSQRLVGVDQPGGSGCGAAFSKIEYGDDGKVTARTSFDGTITRYRHDADGNEIERIEAADTPKARRVTTDWHPDLQLPVHIAAPGREETLAYDDRGNVTERRIAGALDPSDPKATPGIVRTWTATYDPMGQLL